MNKQKNLHLGIFTDSEENLVHSAQMLLRQYKQDNFLYRNSKVRGWFEKNGDSVLLWPTQSPNLNPLENYLWNTLEFKLTKHKPVNLNKLPQSKLLIWFESVQYAVLSYSNATID